MADLICLIARFRKWLWSRCLGKPLEAASHSEYQCRPFRYRFSVVPALAVTASPYRRTAQDDLVLNECGARGGRHQVRRTSSGPCIDFAISTIQAARSAVTFKGSANCCAHDFATPIEIRFLG